MLLSMGKENLYVWEMTPGMVHENDAAERLLALCGQENMLRSETKEGKIELTGRLRRPVPGGQPAAHRCQLPGGRDDRHPEGQYRREKGRQTGGNAGHPSHHQGGNAASRRSGRRSRTLLELLPYVKKTAAIVATGSEVKKGLIQDTFTPVVKEKLAAYGIETISIAYSGDGVEKCG